jgi:prophage regulatory protein
MTRSLIRLPAVIARTGLSRSVIYARMARGEFPTSIRTGPKTIVWVSSEIDDYVESIIAGARPARQSKLKPDIQAAE